ncbi:hypothetical protein BpHYR1_021220 [Brachionus plicatilis]|uniref:Uncharacterized protein n=1 Tax=Brachionus plicatilis TaxID=10195 RepID=A0A3M7T2K1_BRAPC|nr:hypothetical protein BpHYR1_021220 [Brachionus plicatilis]
MPSLMYIDTFYKKKKFLKLDQISPFFSESKNLEQTVCSPIKNILPIEYHEYEYQIPIKIFGIAESQKSLKNKSKVTFHYQNLNDYP